MEVTEALTQALESVHKSAGSSELQASVGDEPIRTLEAKLVEVRAALKFVDEECGTTGAQLAATSCSVATHCLSFAIAEENSEENVGGDFGWGFGAAVAAVIANGLAVAALGLCCQGDRDSAKELLPWLSLDLDRISPYLFGGLVRLDAELMLLGETEHLMRSFQAICAWVLLALGFSAGGYAQLPKGLLWAWTDGDAVWTFLLAKGVLSLRSGRDDLAVDIQTPSDLPLLQAAVLEAVLQLPSTTLAFPADTEFGDAGQVPMTQRTEALVRHRSNLADAAARCDILCTLLWTALQEASDVGMKLATFLVDLLQPDLASADPEWAAASPNAREVVATARAAAGKVAQNLCRHCRTLWEGLSLVPRAHQPEALFGELPHGFLQTCAVLAYFCPAQDEALQIFLQACLKCRSPTTGALVEDDGASLAALCILAANSKAAPAATSTLTSSLVGLSVPAQQTILDYWDRWKGPLCLELLQHWALECFQAALQRGPPLDSQPTAADACNVSNTTALSTSIPPAKGGKVALQALLRQAPEEFCCALDGQLMWDPVRSPHGHVFERSSIVSVLARDGRCPLTALPLQLTDCCRLPELRRRIAQWVRSQCPKSGRT